MEGYKGYNFEQLLAAIPDYSEDGANITRTIWMDGSVLDIDQKLKVFIRDFKGKSKYNVELLMKRQQLCFARKQLLPIPMSHRCFLLPVKVRKPIGASDGAYGYVALDGIDKVEHGSQTIIHLKNCGQPIVVRDNYTKLMQQVTIVRSIREQFFDV